MEKPVLNGTEIATLCARIKNLRKTQEGATDPRAIKIFDTRINFIKENISRHASCNFSETVINHALNL